MNTPTAARRSQEAGFTQPRDHLLADPCISTKVIGGGEIRARAMEFTGWVGAGDMLFVETICAERR